MIDPETFTFYYPISVRFADLDPQGHVNNAVYLTYLESARLGYYQAAGIWHRDSGMKTGMVVARIEIDYLAPIFFGQSLRVGLRMERMGNKSFTLAFQIELDPQGNALARGKSTMVTYDNQAEKSMPIPLDWRKKINKFEGWDEHDDIA